MLNEETLEQNRIGLRCLANLLLKMKNPAKLQLHLLEMVCEKCPPRSLNNCVQVSCPAPGQCLTCLTHTPHSVSALGFVLLEEIEGVFGSVEQKVEKILLPNLTHPWLTALGSRVLRQEEMMMEFKMKNVKNVVCRELSHASAFYNLVEKSPVWEFDPEQPGDSGTGDT